MRWSVLLAGLLGAIGVGIGAYAAHGLAASLQEQGLPAEEIERRLQQCDVAVRYHMTHVLAILVLGLCGPMGGWCRSAAIVAFLIGLALFSGGLYSLVFLGQAGHWAIVPTGGACFIVGWLLTAGLAWQASRTHLPTEG